MPQPISSLFATAAVLTIALTTQLAAADSLRCGSKFVTRGDHSYKVVQACGEPNAVNKRVRVEEVRRTVRVRCADDPSRWCSVTESHTVEIPVEEWTYDLGKRRLVHTLLFEEGRLIQVTTHGYGSDN